VSKVETARAARRLSRRQITAAAGLALAWVSIPAAAWVGWMMLFNVPHFGRIFMEMRRELPLLTRWVIDAASLLRRFPPLIGLIALPSAAAILLAYQHEHRTAVVFSFVLSMMQLFGVLVIHVAMYLPLVEVIQGVGAQY
jgi:type II secretory pathway component PulF